MKKYRAFVSYSQNDKVWARRIQKSLETYRVPRSVAVDGLAKRKLGRIFRDDDELASEASLGEALVGAIRDSENMIVIASPDAARSKWVNEEIRTFKQIHGSDRIFAVIVAGRPFASEDGAPDDECFPLALRHIVALDGTITDQQDEPLAPDVTKDTFARVRARLAAGLLGLDFDTLWQRDRRRRFQNTGLAACGTAVAVVGITLGLLQLSASQDETALQESRLLAEQAQGLIDARQLDEALKLIVQSLPASLDSPDRPVAPEALAALTRIMTGNADLGIAAHFGSAVEEMVTNPNQEVIARLGNGSFSRFVEGQAAKTYTPEKYMMLLPNGNALRGFSNERNDGSRWLFDQTLSEVNVTTGEEIGGFAYKDLEAAWFLTSGIASNDGGLFAARGSFARTGQIAVFERPIPASNAPQEPIGILKTDIEHIGDAKLGFAAGETLVLLYKDDTSQLLLRWSIGAANYDELIASDPPGACPQPVTTTLAKTHASISPNGEIISLAEPTGDFSWCLTSWDSRTGTQVQRGHFEDFYASVVQPLSKDRWLAIPGASSFGRSPSVLSADGNRWDLYGCDGHRALFTGLSLNSTQTNVLFLEDTRIVCSSGADILLLSEGRPTRTLSNHSAEISALTVTQDASGTTRLWSSDRSGMVRIWDLDAQGQTPEPEPGQSKIPIIARSTHSIAILSAAADRGMAVSVWTLNGDERLAVTPVSFLPKVETPGSSRQVAMRILNANKALITESRCPISLADAAPTDCTLSAGRATVLDLQTGLALDVIDNLAKGGADLVPLAIAGNAMVLVSADGVLYEVDLATQQRTTLLPPPIGQVRDVAFVDGVLWATTFAEITDTFESRWRLYRQSSTGWDLVLDQRLDTMSLHLAPRQDKAVVLSKTLSKIQAQVISSDGITVQGAPFEKRVPLVIQPPGYAGTLLLDEDGVDALEADGQIRDLAAFSMAVEYDFLDRAKLSDDHATLVWIGDEKAQVFSLPEGTPLCTGLTFLDPEDAVFSPDGSRVAIKHDNAQSVAIVDLLTCIVQHRVPAENDRLMIMPDIHTLWQTAQDGRQLITTKADHQQLLNRARQLVETLQ